MLLGWIFHNPVWIQIKPQFVAMVINTASCFTLLGIALLSPLFLQGSRKIALQRLLGWLVFWLASLVMVQIIFRVDLGIDWREQREAASIAALETEPSYSSATASLGVVISW